MSACFPDRTVLIVTELFLIPFDNFQRSVWHTQPGCGNLGSFECPGHILTKGHCANTMSSSEPVPEVCDTLPVLPARSAEANKGDFGRVLIVAGSRGMSGAAALCGSAALRSGAGLVRLAVPQGILPLAAAFNPCYMTAPLPEDDSGRLSAAAVAEVLELARANTVGAVGPGIGRGPDLTALVLALVEQTRVPLVVDADGLNALVGHSERLKGRP